MDVGRDKAGKITKIQPKTPFGKNVRIIIM